MQTSTESSNAQTIPTPLPPSRLLTQGNLPPAQTSPVAPAATDRPTPPSPSSPDQPKPPPTLKPQQPLTVDAILGKADLRTPDEDLEFVECETMVRDGWLHFARVGDALVRIRDKRLYKNEYHSFEVYCRERWGFGHSKVWGYISAAQVHKALAATPGIPLPECEAQVRPLVGLSAQLALEAWLKALSSSAAGYVPARRVRRAVKHVLKEEQPGTVAEAKANKQQRYRVRQSVRTGFDELLSMLLGTADRPELIAKVQEIQRLLDPLLTPKKTKG